MKAVIFPYIYWSEIIFFINRITSPKKHFLWIINFLLWLIKDCLQLRWYSQSSCCLNFWPCKLYSPLFSVLFYTTQNTIFQIQNSNQFQMVHIGLYTQWTLWVCIQLLLMNKVSEIFKLSLYLIYTKFKFLVKLKFVK